ncbi:TPA: oligosaccharide flippase family protein [Staphylococcus aureus]|nr:oligosaccharide flippase family protein [Staphylococcus aureus]
MKHKEAFNGVVVLTAALIVIKILSAVYRIPYQNILGDTGLYAYQQVYPIVALGMILSMNAIPSAITQNIGKYHSDEAYAKAVAYIQLVGILIFIAIFVFANNIAHMMGDGHLTPMIQAASLSFIFIGMLGVLRGYYQSANNMTVPAISQVIEQVIRVGIIIVTIVIFVDRGWTIYEAGTIAILASTIGFLGSSIYLVAHRPFKFKMVNNTAKIVWKQFALSVLIFAISQLIVILWQVIDSVTIIKSLQAIRVPFDVAITEKGVYDRGASFIQMGLIVTTTFSFALIPLLSDAIKMNNQVLMNRYANASLKITILISTAAGIGLINLLPLMNGVFFKTNDLTLTLSVYMITVICVSLIIFGTIIHIAVTRKYHLHAMRRFFINVVLGMVFMSIVVQCVLNIVTTHGRFTGLIELLCAAVLGIIALFFYIFRFNVLTYKELTYLPFGSKLYQIKKGRR